MSMPLTTLCQAEITVEALQDLEESLERAPAPDTEVAAFKLTTK